MNWRNAFYKYTHAVIPAKNESKIKVTVIVPFRDEIKNISKVFDALAKQNYPAGMLQIIFSDDHSTDGSANIIREKISLLKRNDIEVLLLNQQDIKITGKKTAIENAIQNSKGELILTTDADCTMEPGWASSFAAIYELYKPQMITGMVRMKPLGNFFEKMQGLEFLSLTGTGAASVINHKPLLCNGANLAFSREAFHQAGGYSYGGANASGDDIFLMLSMNKQQVVFNSHPQSIITTLPAENIDSFLSQRIRWSSKVKEYREAYVKLTGLFIGLVNLVLLFVVFGWMGGILPGKIIALSWMVKLVADFLFLQAVTAFVKQEKLLWMFLPVQLVYPFYILTGVIVGIASKGFTWKNRKFF